MAAIAAAGLPARANPPQRNLRIELRFVERDDRSAQALAARGAVIVGTGGVVSARPSVALRSGSGNSSASAVQQLLVLNGGRAGVRFAENLPLQWAEVAMTPQGPVAVLRQEWVSAGQGFDVGVHWPGGDAPVTLDVAADRGDGLRGERWNSRLQLPMGEWVAVARTLTEQRAAAAGVLSTRDVERRVDRELQLRVSLP